MRALLLGLAGVLLAGCLSSAPIVPVTPTNQAQVASCQSTATLHDGVVVGDFVLGGATTTLGAVAALEPAAKVDLKNALAISTAIVGGVGVVGAAITTVTATNFANSHCTDVVAPLPAKPAPAASPGPPADLTTVTMTPVGAR